MSSSGSLAEANEQATELSVNVFSESDLGREIEVAIDLILELYSGNSTVEVVDCLLKLNASKQQ